MDVILSNLRTLHKQADDRTVAEGLVWYAAQHATLEALALRHEIPVVSVCGVCAALSPGSEWSRNVYDTSQLLKDNSTLVGVYGRRNRDKALAIMGGTNPLHVLGSNPKYQKTVSFFLNLAYPNNPLAVTVDRHMKCAGFGIKENRDANSIVTKSEYVAVEQAIRQLADENRILPHQQQAIIWLQWKKQVKESVFHA